MKELFITHLIAIASVGPNTVLMLQAATSGRKTILLTALGITIAQFAHISYSLAFGQILSQSYVTGLTLIGCAYLVYMGVMTIKYADSESKSITGSFKNGLIVNLLNGKVAVYFVSIFPPLTAKLSHVELTGVISIISAMVFLWFSGLGLIGNHRAIKGFLEKYQVRLNYFFGFSFIALGAVLAKKTWL